MKEFQNITKKQIEQNGVRSLSDRPNSVGAYGSGGLSPLELKVAFDRLAALIAEKVNEIHNVLASDVAAEYIAIALHEDGIHDLSQLVTAIKSGALANILELYPTAGSDKRVNLQNTIYDIAKLLSDHDHDINEVLKKPPFTEHDPTVPAWAKQPTKPSYTASEVDAAPAGFGLGTINKMIDDPDSVTESGFYQFISDKLTGSNVNWYLISQHHNEAYADQIAIHVMYGYVLKRTKANYAWGEWEYLNPPMALGVEYRTTERWKGRPVYVKMVDCGEMPSAGTHKNITVTVGLPDTHKLVGMECVFESELYGDSSLKRYCVNYCTETNNSGEIKGLAWGWSSYSGISVTIKAIGDITNYSAVATVKYVK